MDKLIIFLKELWKDAKAKEGSPVDTQEPKGDNDK